MPSGAPLKPLTTLWLMLVSWSQIHLTVSPSLMLIVAEFVLNPQLITCTTLPTCVVVVVVVDAVRVDAVVAVVVLVVAIHK